MCTSLFKVLLLINHTVYWSIKWKVTGWHRQWKANLKGLLESMNDRVKRSKKKKAEVYSQSIKSNSSTHCHIIKQNY